MPWRDPDGAVGEDTIPAPPPSPVHGRVWTPPRPPSLCSQVFYELPWTLAAGGAVVGYLTNWIALKLIFEPIDPVRACMHACIFFLPCTLYTYACIFEPIDPVRL